MQESIDLSNKIKFSKYFKDLKNEVKSEKIKELTRNIIRNTKELDNLNKETDKSVLSNDSYKEKVIELTDTLREEILTLKDSTEEMETNREEIVKKSETRIMDIIDKGIELRKEALGEELDNYKEYIDDVLEERDRASKTSDYEEDIKKDLETQQEIQDKINKLSFDTSMKATQQRKKLEEDLADQKEQIAERQSKREDDLIKQNYQDNVRFKEEAQKDELDRMDEEFSEAHKKVLAHNALMNESFDEIKQSFPELFEELSDGTIDFFETFKTYEEKFGDVMVDVAKNFKDEIMPELLAAIDSMKKVQDEAKELVGVDYTGVTFDTKKNYQAEINELVGAGFDDSDEHVKNLFIEQAAKIYSDANLTDKWENIIKPKYRKRVEEENLNVDDAISAGTSTIGQASDLQPKVNRYTSSDKQEVRDKLEIQRLQIAWGKAKTQTDKNKISRDAQDVRDKHGWEQVPLLNYKIPEGMQFAKGINNGLVKKTGQYLLHGSEAQPEWVLTNQQMFNTVKNMANDIASTMPSQSSTGTEGINLSINISGNADKNTINGIRDAGKTLLFDIKKELNKSGIYK